VTRTYRDRGAAGELLAGLLRGYAERSDVLVLGLVRGGVLVAAVVAGRLNLPLDVLVVRKLGVPWATEVAFGALGPGGVRVINDDIAGHLSPADIAEVVHRESEELRQREAMFRRGRGRLDLTGRTAILVDDGLATGATARAAVAVARRLGAARVVLAAPVGSPEAAGTLEAVADEVVCPLRPPWFRAVGRYYRDFHQVTDDEVIQRLASRRDSGG
jgi:putative phosphoribosyl transferase